MRLLRTFLALLIGTCLVLSPLPATAENLLTVDMLQASSYLNDLPNLLDDDEKTLWTSAKGGEQYLQIDVPEGDVFTLLLQWGRIPKRLQLMREQDGRWVELFAHSYDEELPERFVLSPGGHTYRLVAQGTLSLAEASLAQGEVAAPTATPVPEPTATPTIMPTPMPTDTPAPTDTPIPTAAPTIVPTTAPTATPEPTAVPTAILTEVPSPSPTEVPMPTPAALQAAQPPATTTPPPPVYDPAEDASLLTFRDMPTAAEDETTAPDASPASTEEQTAEPGASHDASALLAYVKSKVGKGYLDGCSGELCTLALRAEKAQLYPDQAESILGIAEKWDGVEVYDGAGLLAGFLAAAEDAEGWQSDLAAILAQWNPEPKPLASMPTTPGILLLHEKEGGGYDRVGVYAGEGRSIHARGYAYGVVVEQMPYLWTHWAVPEWLRLDLAEEADVSFPGAYMAPGTMAKVDTRDGELAVLYVEPAGEDGLIGTGYGILNQTLVDIEEAPASAPDWRKISYTDKDGTTTAGYVHAEDLRVPVQ